MANQLILDRAEDVNGFLAPGALATVYAAGTSTLIPVYADAAGTIPAPNPIVADGNGFWPQRFVAVAAKVVVTTAAMAPLYTLDPAPTALGIGTSASQISFLPTIDLPFTNVQAAIEGAAAFATSGFSAFGLGITGNAALLANLDATNTGAGVYRFDGTTTGTFPSGVVAGDTGMVELWRQTSGVAMQMLYHATTDRVFHRRMAASTWGTWREVITSNQAPVEGDILYRGASTWTRLAKGTAGQVLQMNSSATVPEWGPPSIGVGQTWQDVTGSRSASTSYQNTTGRPIVVAIYTAGVTGNHTLEVSTNNSSWLIVSQSGSASALISTNSAIVPPGHYYRYTGNIAGWRELR